MKLLYVATSYPSDDTDWKGVFIRKLAAALAQRSEISLATWTPPGPLPLGARSVASKSELHWLGKLMDAGGIAHVMRTQTFARVTSPLKLLYLLSRLYRRSNDIDVYHLNWLQTAIPLPSKGKPVLITVLGTDLKLLHLPMVKKLLRRVMHRRPVAICPNADWMIDQLEEAFGDLAIVKEVPFGIDPAWYKIKRTPDNEKTKWLAVTRLTHKKLGPLLEWSAPLFKDQCRELHLIGPMQENIDLPEWIHYHGSASPEQIERDWFPKAHGLITLSEHAEGRPQVMLEAMAAGLPMIASNMPAHKSIVRHKETGMIISTHSDYVDALNRMEDLNLNLALGKSAKAWIKDEVGTWDDSADRYSKIYRQLKEQDYV